ncbi:MAG: DUF6537 domain-containing protein, partial [Pseudomonadota bacterium]|nr:DUF6537 domain-containing protein [Pseudomonadota bacterium]
TGLPKKREFGGWVLPAMSLLSKLKWLRGRWCDPFSYNHERKVERELITDYRAMILAVLDRLNADNYVLATELAELPEMIRGYGHVKLDSVELYYDRKKQLLRDYENDAGVSAVKIIESCEVVEV